MKLEPTSHNFVEVVSYSSSCCLVLMCAFWCTDQGIIPLFLTNVCIHTFTSRICFIFISRDFCFRFRFWFRGHVNDRAQFGNLVLVRKKYSQTMVVPCLGKGYCKFCKTMFLERNKKRSGPLSLRLWKYLSFFFGIAWFQNWSFSRNHGIPRKLCKYFVSKQALKACFHKFPFRLQPYLHESRFLCNGRANLGKRKLNHL
jgi:hypothetical protein